MGSQACQSTCAKECVHACVCALDNSQGRCHTEPLQVEQQVFLSCCLSCRLGFGFQSAPKCPSVKHYWLPHTLSNAVHKYCCCETRTNTLADKQTPPHTGRRQEDLNRQKWEVEEIEEFGNIWIFRWIVHKRTFPTTNLRLQPFLDWNNEISGIAFIAFNTRWRMRM